VCEVVWNPARNWMILGTAGARMMDAFLEYFERQFQLYPVPLYHAPWAFHMLPLTPDAKEILASLVPIKSPTALNDGRFLGWEFLTWVWYYIERMGGSIETGDKIANIHLGERMVLVLPGDSKERVVCTTQANFLHEARTGLRQGKVVDEAQFFLMIGENEYLLTLDSSLWVLKGLKTPKQLPDYGQEDPDGRFLEKMYFIEEVLSTIEALYMRFLTDRLNSGWETGTLAQIKRWIDEGETAPVTGNAPPPPA
jgi:hypothetical protein